MEEYADLFIIGTEQVDQLKEQQRIMEAKIEAYLSDNSIGKIEVKASQKELEDIIGRSISDSYELLSLVEKRMGFKVPVKETSVREFYSYIKQIRKENRKLSKDGKDPNKAE